MTRIIQYKRSIDDGRIKTPPKVLKQNLPKQLNDSFPNIPNIVVGYFHNNALILNTPN